MNPGLTKTEMALLEALEAERTLNRRRSLTQGIILHEMSNALTALLGGVELLELKLPAGVDQFDALKDIHRGSLHLRELLAGLRILTGQDDARPQFITGDLAEFVRGVVRDSIAESSSELRARVRVSSRLSQPMKRYCPVLLRHAIGNLVRNALRYGDPAREVAISIGGDRGGRTWVNVFNRGPRIPADLAARIFEPGRKSERGGMGLGLHIAQSCALRMGGDLVFGSTRGGTVFSVLMGISMFPTLRRESTDLAPCEVVPLRTMETQNWGACRGA